MGFGSSGRYLRGIGLERTALMQRQSSKGVGGEDVGTDWSPVIKLIVSYPSALSGTANCH